jgi:putative thiamine transport system permease protein
LRAHQQTAQAMGYAAATVWWRVLWPQLLPRLALPLLAVWAYSLTVVDMALVLGPTRPPTLAVLAWQWLLDAEAARNQQGSAAAVLLALLVLAGALAAAGLRRGLRPLLGARRVRGDRAPPAHPFARWGAPAAAVLAGGAGLVYALALLMLLYVSVASVWTFPSLWPQRLSADAWTALAGSARSVGVTAMLAIAASATGVAVALAWLETTPPEWDRRAAPLVFVPMLVPGVLLVSGLYHLALATQVDGSLAGLWLAHSLFTAPYALIALAPAYRSFDPRYAQTAQALGHGRASFLCRIKWPMLLAPILSAAAIGFAVSVTQYLSTQFVGAGRHATVTTEALTLASGGQRPLMAAFALLQALLPALAFAAAWALAQAQARRIGIVERG